MKKNFFRSTMAMALLACLIVPLLGNSSCDDTAQTKQIREKTEQVEALMNTQPPTKLKFSMDRYLLDQRNIRFNDHTKMNYLYVVLIDGTWLKVTIMGKLASTSKRLTQPQQVQRFPVPGYTTTIDSITEAPDEMGTFGESTGSKVGMLTLGSLLEFGGFCSFLYSEIPLVFSGFDKKMVEINVVATDAEKKEFFDKLENMKQKVQRAQ